MRISYNWLKEYISTSLSPSEIAQRLTDSGLEVEGIEEIQQYKGGLQGLFIGEVLSKEKHPNADRLSLTKVAIGNEVLPIVCGAPNVEAGQKVVVATVGTTIYPINGEGFKIKKGKIRGEESLGMICAEDEIGLGKSHDGIMVLDSDAEVGQDLATYYNLESDYAIEIGLTPNRTDAISHIGVARDLAAVLSLETGVPQEIKWPDIHDFKVDNTSAAIGVDVLNADACPRYAGIRLSNVKVSDSPEWLQSKLKSIGLSPVNNIVDIGNFVMHEMGQPLHAFDANKIRGNKVIVKNSTEGQSFVSLDEKERKLSAEDLMICNENEEMCIAGVLGGLDSGVNFSTTELFLESALFNPVFIRKSAKRHVLNTDASFRFERGVDPELTVYALKRAALLIQEIAGATVSSDIIDVYPKKILPTQVVFSKERCDKIIGQKIDNQVVLSILESLDIKVLSSNEDQWMLEVPAYRKDVVREADVIEEILRIYGFNKIELPSKMHASLSYSEKLNKEKVQEQISDLLYARGFNEMMSNSLVSKRFIDNDVVSVVDKNQVVEIYNPLSLDLNVLRQSLIYNGLETIVYNQNRQQFDLSLFEFGSTYEKTNNGFIEESHLAIYLCGTKPVSWRQTQSAYSFYDLKAEVNALLKKLGLSNRIESSPTNWKLFSEGMNYSINDEVIVKMGIVDKQILDYFSIKQEVLYADINWSKVLNYCNPDNIKFKEIPKFPAVHRDLSLLLDKHIKYQDLHKLALKVDRKILKSVTLFDVYEGSKIELGKKSYSLRFTLQDENRTLKDKQIDKVMKQIQFRFEKEFGASLR